MFMAPLKLSKTTRGVGAYWGTGGDIVASAQMIEGILRRRSIQRIWDILLQRRICLLASEWLPYFFDTFFSGSSGSQYAQNISINTIQSKHIMRIFFWAKRFWVNSWDIFFAPLFRLKPSATCRKVSLWLKVTAVLVENGMTAAQPLGEKTWRSWWKSNSIFKSFYMFFPYNISTAQGGGGSCQR